MIEVKNAAMDFGGEKTALDGVSLSIPDGCAYALLGSNGAGKSTLLRLLAGIYRPVSGTVEIDGKSVYDDPKVKEKVFYIGDETIQFNGMTLDDMRKYYKRFYPSFSDELFEKLLGIVRLPRGKKLMTFSKGMKRQAAVICGVSCGTGCLLVDEAFDGLDPTMRDIVKQILIDAMLDKKMTVLFSSHNISEMDEFCDRVGLLHQGKVIFDRELDSVKGSVVKLQMSFDRDVKETDFAGIDVLRFEKTGSVVHLTARGDREKIIAAAKALSPAFCDDIPLSLEEIFIFEMEVLGYDKTRLED